MIRFLQVLIEGIALGSIYSLLALSFVIIYRATKVLSLAQPSIMLLSAYFTVYFRTVLGLDFWVAVGIAIVLGAALASVVERVVVRPLAGMKEAVLGAVMVTIGVDVVLRVVGFHFIGSGVRGISDPWQFSIFHVGSVRVFERDAAAIAVAWIVAGVLLVFLRRTRYGLAMRATADDQESALAKGIPIGRMFNLSWLLAGALAAVAGTFVSVADGGLSQATYVVALKALPVIILGGLDSIGGALLAGVVIGVAEAMTAVYQPSAAPWLGSNFSIVVPYVVMVLVLLVRPYGLFGTREVERV